MKRSRKLLKTTLAVAALLAMPMVSWGAASALIGTPHDVVAGGEVCDACHAPHNNVSTTDLLWSHTMGTTAADGFQMYSSTTFSQTLGNLGSSSMLCMSCHDGTVAVDAYVGHTPTLGTIDTIGTGSADLGSDLRNDHPVSFSYAASKTADGTALVDEATVTAAGLPLYGGEMECGTCHDPHDYDGAAPTSATFLRMDNDTSQLCTTCHVK